MLNHQNSLRTTTFNNASVHLINNRFSDNPRTAYNRNFSSPRGNMNRGRGRGCGFGHSKPICQVCGKMGHVANICFHRFDKQFSGSRGNYSVPNNVPGTFNGGGYRHRGTTSIINAHQPTAPAAFMST